VRAQDAGTVAKLHVPSQVAASCPPAARNLNLVILMLNLVVWLGQNRCVGATQQQLLLSLQIRYIASSWCLAIAFNYAQVWPFIATGFIVLFNRSRRAREQVSATKCKCMYKINNSSE
jgi:hypothetical protein